MNKHKKALDILIHELCDFVGAETYCVTNGQSTGVIPDDCQRPTSLKDKPLPIIIEEDDSNYISPENLNERKTLFTMLFKSYLSIKDRYETMETLGKN
jgi:hypothetical protein